jgi:hypothetical protein
MDDPRADILFVGDLDDPCVSAIADALPASALRLNTPSDLPDTWPELASTIRSLVIHRSILTAPDAERLRRLRNSAGGGPRVVLCYGPHTRYHHLVRWSTLADVILPEATAPDVIGRHVGDGTATAERRSAAAPISVVSSNHELRFMLADICRDAGYTPAPARDWTEAAPDGLVLWDVPILETDWLATLARQARSHTVITLLGFADRVTVSLARERGAAACLDLPCDVADLTFVLDRIAACRVRVITDAAHAAPPAPAALGRIREGPISRAASVKGSVAEESA